MKVKHKIFMIFDGYCNFFLPRLSKFLNSPQTRGDLLETYLKTNGTDVFFILSRVTRSFGNFKHNLSPYTFAFLKLPSSE